MADDDVSRETTVSYPSGFNPLGASIVLLTNPEQEIHRLELTLRSMILDGNGKPKRIGPPMLNERGIVAVLGLAQSVVNQVAILSNFNKLEVSSLMLFCVDTISRDLMINRVKYGIEDSTARDRIFFTVLTYCFITLKRGFEEGDKRFWRGTQQHIRTEVVNPDRGSKGGKNIFGWGK